ncbi:MAG: radical SAM protein [Deltaproteobacteria bacterium]|nr:radical SAM protein [Deltaproteobacteria bacterium]
MGEPSYPDLTRLYRWPFGVADNPNVVIEPTTACNLACAHCYRDSANPDKRRKMMTPDEARRYIDEALTLRQFHTLSILGGEPLLYPHLDEVVLYARAQGLAVGLYTNGELLHKYRARELKTAGVSYVYVHVDRHQGRTDGEAETATLRAHFCEMFRKLSGMSFGFGIIVHEEDLPELPALARFLAANADVVRFVNLSLLGPCPPQDATTEQLVEEGRRVDAFQRRACEAIRAAFGFEFCSYLGSKFRPEVPGKLLAVTGYERGKRAAAMTALQFGSLSRSYRDEHGRYPYLLSKECTDYFGARLSEGRAIDWQYVAISLSPLLLDNQRWNVCHHCTDCVLFDHHFVPMCLLDPLAAGDPLIAQSVRYW